MVKITYLYENWHKKAEKKILLLLAAVSSVIYNRLKSDPSIVPTWDFYILIIHALTIGWCWDHLNSWAELRKIPLLQFDGLFLTILWARSSKFDQEIQEL